MTALIEDTRMNREASELVRQLEQDDPKTRKAKAIPLYETSKIIAGYLHAREALKKLKGLPYKAEHLKTGKVCENDKFPTIDINGILNEEGVWHYEDDPRFSMEGEPLALVSAVSPINTWNHASAEYGWIGTFLPQEKERTSRIKELMKQKDKELLDYAQNEFWNRGRTLNDGTDKYLHDEVFLRAAIRTARMNLEGVFAKHQAGIDAEEELAKAREDGRLSKLPSWWNSDRTESIFATGIIRHLYAPIVSEAIPGEEPYRFNFVDREYLESHL